MYKKVLRILILGALLVIAGCSTNVKKEDAAKNTDDSNVKIATIGVAPSLDTSSIKFENIQLEDLKNTMNAISKNYHAVFIMPEFLSAAADDTYISAYEQLKIPIFFIESTKDELPFINEGITYENAPVVNSGNNFATGYLNNSSNKKELSYVTWKYQLASDVNKKEAVKNVYMKIFETISDYKFQTLSN